MPMYYGYDSTWFIILPAFLLALFAQYRVKSTFNKYSSVSNKKGITGAEVAKYLLDRAGINDVRIEYVKGNLSDHYDPRMKVLRLSDSVYNSTSIAAVGVAAHETGHAIQHDAGYVPLSFRNTITPIVSFGNNLAFPLILIGLFLSSGSGGLGALMIDIGIILFAGVVVFQLITLPVEFNASGRAIELLSDYNILTDDEIIPAKKVLNAAALTYVAAAASAISNLIRYMALSRSRKR